MSELLRDPQLLIEQYQLRAQTVDETPARQEQQQSLLTSLEEFTRGIQASLDNPSFETKQKILRLVVDKIEFKEDEIGIKHLIPISNARLQLYRFQRAVSGRPPIDSRMRLLPRLHAGSDAYPAFSPINVLIAQWFYSHTLQLL